MQTSEQVDLKALADFKHQETVLRFMDSYEVSYDESADLFEEMKKLLALMAAYPDEYVFTHEPLWIIDEMWHTFLMYTKDYIDFCNAHFGRILHHAPVKRDVKMQIREDLENEVEETYNLVRPQVKRLYELIFEYLGRETLVKWIDGYGNKYTLAFVNEIRKPIV